MADVVVKNKNIEGGMGIFFYKNAVHGGDWIIQVSSFPVFCSFVCLFVSLRIRND